MKDEINKTLEEKQNEHIEKFISLILRHHPETINIKLDSGGWANVDELIEGINKAGTPINREKLEEIVQKSLKKRFSFNYGETKIRANQGHSFPVELGLEPMIPPEILYHGTATRFLDSILKYGILKKTRQEVNLSIDIETAINVGKRHGKPVVLEIDTIDMTKDECLFYLSDNGVWMTNDISPKYIKKIIEI